MFEGCGIVTHLDKHNDVYKEGVCLHCIGPNGVKVYNSLTFATGEDPDHINAIIKKLNEYFIEESNETYDRYVLNKSEIEQREGEIIDAYVGTLRT